MSEEWRFTPSLAVSELPQLIAALLFPVLMIWSWAAVFSLAYPDYPYDVSGPIFPLWARPPIFGGKWGTPFMMVLILALTGLCLNGLRWMFGHFAWWLVLMFVVLGGLLGNKVYQWQRLSKFSLPAAIALILGDVGLVVLHWMAGNVRVS